MSDTRTPVTVLTGFLGAGKTTLLNRILTEQHGRKYAVVINEFGELGVDNDLVVDADEEVFEMNNGCICCTVRGDLIRIVGGLMRRSTKFDGIIIETTGLANPAPVAQTFFVDDGVKARARLDAIITVVDAKNLAARLEDTTEAAAQIAFADVIVLNKLDLVTAAEVTAAEARIRAINRFARIHHATRSDVPVTDILDIGAFDLQRILGVDPDFLEAESHSHSEGVNSVSFEVERDIDPHRFEQWMGTLLQEKGQDLLRTKGILAHPGEDRRFAFQAVHMIADGDYISAWPAGAPRRSRLVFIGRDLNRPQLRRGFEACQVRTPRCRAGKRMSQTLVPDLLATRGITHQLGAYVVACVFDRAGTQAAFGLGDGTLRLATLADPADWQTVQAHDGGLLCLAQDAQPTGFLTGGDDASLVRTGPDAAVQRLADFGGKWAEQVASFTDAKSGVIAAAAGRKLHLFTPAGEKLRELEHPSTVTGIAFDGRGKRVAVSHYNGASVWFVNSTAPAPRRLDWKGSHTAIAVHPAAEAVVTAMQESALHGWRLPDGHDMRMSGYPTRPETLGFTRSGKYLASSGADAVVLWPFFGGGPMGKPPLELAQIENVICTRMACHPVQELVAAGYADGTVAVADIASRRVLLVAPPGQGPEPRVVTALAWSPSGGWLGFGTESGFAGVVRFEASGPF